ncbi:MAG: aminoglycoside phosphotransferase family protein [Candidatus Bathyarchaeota archaeon]|nr:MAG: aminoglycoside phosphotransferase family protein [Candidatus Bathyarchaeota archaeon]
MVWSVFELQLDKLREYLSSVFGADVEVRYFGELGKRGIKPAKPRAKLKGFGYGVPYEIRFVVRRELKSVILETMRPGGFGHEHFSDRAGILLWQHSAFSRLPRHVKAVDVGAFTKDEGMKSLGDCEEFFVITQRVKGRPYFLDLDGVMERRQLAKQDRERCLVLSKYLVEIHSVKGDDAGLYIRRIRDLVGHGECIMGLCDSYPGGLEYISDNGLCKIERSCVDWRWRLKRKTHRVKQVHGDYHPWNILFRRGTGFSVIDRSRGEWGEAADDVSAMTINYLFYSLRTYGELRGPFEELFNLFWENYLNETGDQEILEVIQPFYAWRGLVVASPIWYPNLSLDVRVKLLNFVRNVLETERFSLGEINSYIKS